MLKKRTVGLLFSLLLLCSLCLPAWGEEPGPEPEGITAQAAIVMEASTGRILYARNEHERLSMASTTKIMTTLLALSYPELDREFVVNEEAIRVEGSSMGLLEGDTVTMRALCYGMLLESGNDAANVAAYEVAGSIGAFVDMMNGMARTLGMHDSSFETPSGLDGENHYSTAYDMALLTQAALQNPDFVSICSQTTAQVSYGNPPYQRWLTNHNRLLKEYGGCIGIKTGFTKKSGRCLVSAAERDGVRLICVTLNAPDDWNDHKKLLDYGFEQVTLTTLEAKLDTAQLPVVGGLASDIEIYASDVSINAVLPQEDVDQLQMRVYLPHFLYAPVQAGEEIGRIEYWLEDDLLAEFPIWAGANIDYAAKEGLWEKIKGIFS